MPAVPERTDWFTLEDVHRHAVQQRCGRSVFASVQREVDRHRAGVQVDVRDEDGDAGGDLQDSYEVRNSEDDQEAELTNDEDDPHADGADSGDECDSGDEFDNSDEEFDTIVAQYEEPDPGGSGSQAAPDTCQLVEDVTVELEVCFCRASSAGSDPAA